MAVIFKFDIDYLDALGERHNESDLVTNGAVVLFIRSGDKVYGSWPDLPDELKARGGFAQDTDSFKSDGRYVYDGILVRGRAQSALLEQYGRRKTGAGIRFGPNGFIQSYGVPSDCPENWYPNLETGNCDPKSK